VVVVVLDVIVLAGAARAQNTQKSAAKGHEIDSFIVHSLADEFTESRGVVVVVVVLLRLLLWVCPRRLFSFLPS